MSGEVASDGSPGSIPSGSPNDSKPGSKLRGAGKAVLAAQEMDRIPQKGQQESRVEAMVRVRPFNTRELERLRAEDPHGVPQSIVHIDPKGTSVTLLDPEKGYSTVEKFNFDEALWSIPEEQWGLGEGVDDFIVEALKKEGRHCVDQAEVYEKTGAKVVQHAFDGFHSCIFAYGQTGSGKTYTMLGGLDEKGQLSAGLAEDRGICIRIVENLFEKLEYYSAQGEDMRYQVKVSFMEIYKEKCKDLILKSDDLKRQRKQRTSGDQEKDYEDLRVRQDPSEGTYVQGLHRKEIRWDGKRSATEAATEVARIMSYGMECRHTAATKMNDVSSRSHAIFQIAFKQQNPLTGLSTLSNINLVDLAGSERLKLSGAEGARADEATRINLSLSTLRRVIDVLIENAKKKKGQMKSIPPYRESVLTWLLSESLGGNSKTLMIATVSPYRGNFEDTYNTLRYANKAKEIVCKVRRNDERGAIIVSAMRAEMERLRQQLESKEQAQDESVRLQLKQQLAEAELAHERARAEFEELSRQGELLRAKHGELQQELQQKEREKEELRRKQEETRELRSRREKLEREAERAGAQADELSTHLQKAESEIAITRAEKEQLKLQEKHLREKEKETRLEMQQTKQRQLALAFRNSLQIHKDRKFMETLASQQSSAKEKYRQIEQQLEEKKRALAAVQDEHRHLTMNFELAQQRLDDVNRNYDDTMALLQEKIDNINQKKRKAESELAHYQEEVQRKTAELEEIRTGHKREQEAAGETLRKLEEEYSEAVRTNEQTDREIAEAHAAVAAAKQELQELREQHRRLGDDNAQAAKELAEVEAEHRTLTAENKALRSTVSEAREQLSEADRQKLDVEQDIDQMTQEIRRITRSHEDLKQFVSQRFFPSRQAASGDQPPQQRPAAPSRPKLSEPKLTLKSQQLQERAAAQKAQASQGKPGAAAGHSAGGPSSHRSHSKQEQQPQTQRSYSSAGAPARKGAPPTAAVGLRRPAGGTRVVTGVGRQTSPTRR
eukprot:TRINITY_DN1220_c1_g1_i2.p1 TRINITY_DN1220_c1_g1~~TRINITY_DN1220_c1_g1_i2.p1  ORF type:complete len:1044 (+),score=434.51 TRINITY_DN1220_c1_g1_i2:111-3134(+)